MSNIFLPRELLYVMENVQQTYRPLPWRSLMNVNTEIPAWSAFAEVSKIEGAAEIVPVDDVAPSDLPRASLSRESVQFKLIEFGTGYRVFDREIERAQMTRVKPSMERAMATTRAAETFLDETAATGDRFGIGLPGLLNNAEVAITLPGAGGYTGNWFTTGTADSILTDLHVIGRSIYRNSKQTRNADSIIMDVDTLDRLSELRISNTSQTVLQMFKEQWAARGMGPLRMMAWERMNQSKAVYDGRILVGNLAAADVAEFLLPRDFTNEAPIRFSRGFEVDQFLIAGGVKIVDSSGLEYFDGSGVRP